MLPGRQRGQVAAVTAVAVALLGGGGGAGYYLHGPAESFPIDRLVSLEQWRAERKALEERDREEHSQLTQALRESNSTNSALREAVVLLTERLGSTRESLSGLETRVRALESTTRPATYRR